MSDAVRPPYKERNHDPMYLQALTYHAGIRSVRPEFAERLRDVEDYRIRIAVAIYFFNTFSRFPNYPFNTWREQYDNIREVKIDASWASLFLAHGDMKPMGRRKVKGVQAKVLQDNAIFAAITNHTRGGLGACIWDMKKDFPEIPEKVLRAKLKKMVKKKLITGCTCGCRGDFQILDFRARKP